MKTLIELFDECQLENIIAALSFNPEKIVFVGFSETMKEPLINNLRNLFRMRGADVQIECEIVGRYNFQDICNTLNRIIDTNEDCCFDLTGGKELVLVAMGAVSEARSVPMLQFDIKKKKFVRVQNTDLIPEPEPATMTIAENVALYGGSIVKKGPEDMWDLNDEFVNDVKTMWNICKKNCTLWNKHITKFENIESAGSFFPQSLKVNITKSALAKVGCSDVIAAEFFADMVESGLIVDFDVSDDSVSFGYKNEQIRTCMQKAGSVLELYTYITALEIMEENPRYASSIEMSVRVDWDGIIHDAYDTVRDTRNEIDVMIMRGLVPVFVSCKNGEIDKNALYELYTVAESFGGEYAKKVIVASRVAASATRRNHIIQRARDMGIQIVYDVHLMTEQQFRETMKQKI